MISLFMMYVLFWYTSVTKALTRLQQLSYRNDKYQRDLKKAWWIQPYGDLVILMLSYFAYMVDGNHQSSIYLLMIMGISFFFYQRQHRQTGCSFHNTTHFHSAYLRSLVIRQLYNSFLSGARFSTMYTKI